MIGLKAIKMMLASSLLAISFTHANADTGAESGPVLAGTNYSVLQPKVATSAKGKIEVVELFWYGCPHCFKFERTIQPWARSLPEDVAFIKVPAFFGGLWDIHGQLFYTVEALGLGDIAHQAIFNEIHSKGNQLKSTEEIAKFLEGLNVSHEKFTKTYNSFAVRAKVESAKKLSIAYQASGVPLLIVNGKYKFDIASAGGEQLATQVADHLIEKERVAK